MDHLERGLLVELVDAIYVHQNGAITIRFAFDDPYQSMLESMKMHLT